MYYYKVWEGNAQRSWLSRFESRMLVMEYYVVFTLDKWASTHKASLDQTGRAINPRIANYGY